MDHLLLNISDREAFLLGYAVAKAADEHGYKLTAERCDKAAAKTMNEYGEHAAGEFRHGWCEYASGY